MTKPRVSVITPTYNGSAWLPETLGCVFAQTFQDFEVIVIDDGSKESIEACLPSEPRLRYIRQDNAGTSAARNRALAVAKGEFIAFLDHDDKWHAEKLEKQVSLLDRHPEVGFVFCDYASFGSATPRPNGFTRGILSKIAVREPEPGVFLIEEKEIFKRLLGDLFVQIPSTWMIRHELLKDIGGFEPALRRGAEDWHVALRLAEKCQFAYLNHALTMRREYPQSLSASSNSQVEMLRALNLLREKGKISPDARSEVFRMRREYARNLARVDLLENRPEEARKKLFMALEHSSPLLRSTWTDIFHLMKSWF